MSLRTLAAPQSGARPNMVVCTLAALAAERLAALGRTLLDWQNRARGRRMLAELDDRLLSDIGLTRVDVWREVNKPFWRL